MYSNESRSTAELLSRGGLSDYEIARRTGISRPTILSWRRAPSLPEYPYVLGLYLGDGCLYLGGRAKAMTLDIACDDSYPAIVDEAVSAVTAVFPHTRVRLNPVRDSHCVHIRLAHAALGGAFPQHGPGRKHECKIELTDWQRSLTHRRPDAFVRGLIHSDGSRCINRFDTTLPSGRVAHYEYVRYFFTNYSEDIRRIFCEHCELLGIRWTQSNSRNISVSHRDSTAILDWIVGPKA